MRQQNAAIVTDGGITYDGTKHRSIERVLANLKPGEHLWAMFACWRIGNVDQFMADTDKVHFDMENLLDVGGPSCFQCEEMYSPEIASKPCVPVA